MNNRKDSSLSFKNIFKRETKLATYIVTCLTLVVISLSYAMFFQVDNNSKNQVVESGDLKFTFAGNVTDALKSEIISSEANQVCFEPMSAEEADLYSVDCSYRFSVTNDGTLKGHYKFTLQANDENTYEADKMKVILKKEISSTNLESVEGFPKTVQDVTTNNSILVEEELDPYDTVVYWIQIYVDEETYQDEDGGEKDANGGYTKTPKVISYRIEGSGLVSESQPLSSEKPLKKLTDFIKGTVPKVSESSGDAGLYEVEHTEVVAMNALETSAEGWNRPELRYAGPSGQVNNYVKFNNELWRIIGLVNVQTKPDGVITQRLKIIKADAYATTKWDSANTSNWTTASLQTTLNGTYLNDLQATSKNMIATDIRWNLGGLKTNQVITSEYYQYERGTEVWSNNPTYWDGQVALMYPSDYGYASSGDSTNSRADCLGKNLTEWDLMIGCRCASNDWLYNMNQLTLTSDSSKAGHVHFMSGAGYIGSNYALEPYAVRPVVYLNPDVVITNEDTADGSSTHPYELELPA